MQVLIVEDSSIYQHLLASRLKEWGFDCKIAKTGADAWQLLQRSDSPKLVLLDWVLPDVDGVELCRRIRDAASAKSYSYVILLTGKDSKADLLEGMDAGADDYLVKPFDQLELKARLLVGKRIIDLHEELVAARESMRYAATHDSLTGLLNRGEIIEALKRELERVRRNRRPVSILLADVDHFKKVNDTLGHQFGDEVLKEVARRFKAKLRVYDSLGRYGGEEFLMVLPDCDSMTALIRADELRTHIAHDPFLIARSSKNVTVSIGIAASSDDPAADIATFLSRADQCLYEAKRNGRDRVVYTEVAVGRPNEKQKTKVLTT